MCTNRPELIVEIGPGQGALTALLLDRTQKVVAIEIDPEMIAKLAERFDGQSKLTVVHSDVLISTSVMHSQRRGLILR